MIPEGDGQGCSWLPWALSLQLEQEIPSWNILGTWDAKGHPRVRLEYALLGVGIDYEANPPKSRQMSAT